MRNLFYVIIFSIISGFVTLTWNWQVANAQIKPLTYPEIITSLNTKLPNGVFKNKTQLLNFIISEIKKRKVDKPLNESREEDLRQAGATDELIEAIRQNSPQLPKSTPTSLSTPKPTPVSTPLPTPKPTPIPTPTPTLKPDASLFIKQGNNLRDKGDYELSINEYNKAIEVDSQNADAFLNRGIAYHYFGDTELAFKDYRTAIKLKPELGSEDRMKCLLYSKQDYFSYSDNKPDKGIEFCNKVIASQPDFSLAIYMRGVANGDKYKSIEEIADYNKAIELSPKFPLPYLARGLNQLRNQVNISQLFLDFNKIIEMYPKLGRAYLYRGYLYGKRKEFEKAVVEFNKFFELTPRALVNCTVLCYPIIRSEFFDRNDSEKIVSFLDKAIQSNPANIYNYLGRDTALSFWAAKENFKENSKPVKLRDKNKDEAINVAKPQTAQEFYARAVIRNWGGIADVDKVLSLDKEFASAHLSRGYYNRSPLFSLFNEKEFESNDRFMDQAVSLAPELSNDYFYSDVYLGAVRFFSENKQYEKALRFITKLIDNVSSTERLRSALGLRADIYEKMGKMDLAAGDRTRAKELK